MVFLWFFMSLGPGIPYFYAFAFWINGLLDQDQRWRPAKGAPEVPQVPVGELVDEIVGKQTGV